MATAKITIKTAADIEAMREAGRISARALKAACDAAEAGVSTKEIDQIAEDLIRGYGASPAFLGYGGFRGSVCASINAEVVHGVPSKSVKLYRGDLLSIDTGAIYKNWVGDNANTVVVGGDEATDDEGRRLIAVTREALYAGIEQCVPGNRLGDVCAAVGAVGQAAGLGILRDYVGHGIGHQMHEDPDIPNFGRPGTGPRLEVGMVFAIEPMLTLGGERVMRRRDGWTVVTADGSRAAHIEHTVAITADGPDILTLP
ncbi:MAG: type I methionyl aminopeptidase [Actinomycetes bacterium]|jgi:methionyl aminopeptidase|nr:type I methionyl aminopeptidase [Actinomycetes bacterium]